MIQRVKKRFFSYRKALINVSGKFGLFVNIGFALSENILPSACAEASTLFHAVALKKSGLAELVELGGE